MSYQWQTVFPVVGVSGFGSEFITETGTYGVRFERVHLKIWWASTAVDDGPACLLEIRISIFEFGDPIVGEHMLDASANSPAGHGPRYIVGVSEICEFIA